MYDVLHRIHQLILSESAEYVSSHCFFSPSLKKEEKKLMLEDWTDRMHAPLLGVLLVFVFFFNW